MKKKPVISLKIKILTLLVLAVLTSFAIYSIVVKFYVDPYLENGSDLDRVTKIFEFYNNKIDSNKNSNNVYYLGSSSIKEDIDASLIDNLDGSFNHYNLGSPASTPLRRVVELESIINSKPNAVVIGLGYMSFSDNWLFPHDQYALVSEYVDLDKNPELKIIYNETYQDLLEMNMLELLIYKRKFIYAATNNNIDILKYKLIGGKKPYFYKSYNEDFKSESLLLQSNESHDPNFMQRLKDKKDFNEYNIPLEKNVEKLAFEFMIQKLLKNKINVIVIKIPLNPNLLKEIPNQYKNNFDTFLDKISEDYNIPVLDYTSAYEDSYFYDGHHLNKEGRETFSKDLGPKVIKLIGKS